jgi:hypothetical protein
MTSKSQLEVAIQKLEYLLDSQEQAESKFQEFFEQNGIVFKILGYKNFYVFTKASKNSLPKDEFSNLQPEPDFIVQREQDDLFEIFEIKTPAQAGLLVKRNKYREKFTESIASYISQTTVYEDYLTRNPANRVKVKELYGLDIQPDLDIKIVIGLNEYIDKAKIHQQARRFTRKIDIITYDDILNQLKQRNDLYNSIEGAKKGEEYSFQRVVKDNPIAALDILRIHIEYYLVTLASASYISAGFDTSMQKIVAELAQKGAITPREKSLLSKMVDILNYATQKSVSDQSIDWAMEAGPRLLKTLDAKLIMPYEIEF